MSKAVFTYGRFNPPTIGHKAMIENLLKYARKKRATPVIVITHTQNKKKNPLTVDEKVKYMTKMFPTVRIMHTTKEEPTPAFITKRLIKNGFDEIFMMVGSDRVKAFKKFMNIPVESGGMRDPNANNATGMSATKVRNAAKRGNYNFVRSAMNNSITDQDVRNIMKKIQNRIK